MYHIKKKTQNNHNVFCADLESMKRFRGGTGLPKECLLREHNPSVEFSGSRIPLLQISCLKRSHTVQHPSLQHPASSSLVDFENC
jgi:hypothetical protein